MGAGVNGFGSLLRHELEVVWQLEEGTLDPEGEDLGHALSTETVAATVRGLVQPRSSRERASASGRDVNIGTHRIYLEPSALDVVTADAVIRKAGAPDADLDGDYRILFVGNAAGQGHHIEVDADRLT